MTEIRKKGTVIYFAPVEKKYFSQWEYYQVDLDILERCFSKVLVCHDTLSFLRTILSSRISLVYCWWWHRSTICVAVSRLFRIPSYVTGAVHMYDESGSIDFTSKGFIYRMTCRITWRMASVNLFISKSQIRQICSHETVNNPKLLKSSLRASYEIIKSRRTQAKTIKNQLGLKGLPIQFLTIAWMTKEQLKRKSVYETLGALKILIDRGIVNFTWVIAGGDSDGREELEEKITNLGLDSYVTILFDISNEQKISLYGNSDLYVQPSYYEGFGNAVLEAMSFGLPAVVSRNTAQQEVIGDSGFMVEEIESVHIADVLAKYLLLDLEQRSERRELVYKTIDKRHLFQYRLEQFKSLIDSEGN